MLVPILLVLAVVFLVLGFVHVIGLLLAVAIAVACVVALVALSSGARFRRW